METGIQLAALVLRTVPIFQTASGRYRTASGEIAWVVDNTRTALSSKRTHENLEDFLTNLHYELSVLQMVIEKLVNELDTLTADEKDALKRGPVALDGPEGEPSGRRPSRLWLRTLAHSSHQTAREPGKVAPQG